MGVSEIIGLLLVTAASIATLAALLVVVSHLLPERVTRTRYILNQSPRRAFAVGTVNLIFFSVIIAWLSGIGEFFQLIGLLILVALTALNTIGLTAVLTLLHERMQPNRSLLQTAVLFMAAAASPILGWFIFAPLTLITAFGAAIMMWAQRKPSKQPPPF